MANAHVMFGKVADGIPVVTPTGSATVAGGAASSGAPAGTSFVRVTAKDGAVFAQVGGDASASPRAWIPQGAWADLACAVGQTVGVANG